MSNLHSTVVTHYGLCFVVVAVIIVVLTIQLIIFKAAILAVAPCMTWLLFYEIHTFSFWHNLRGAQALWE